MKIKIIDLLTKYANKELTNIKTKYNNCSISEWDEEDFLYSVYKEFGNRNSEEIIEFLNDYVEIIEEPKKIEKITVREKNLGFPNGEWTARNMDKAVAIKINEIIDEINKLKEK